VRLRISEIFASVQGEGVTIGTPSAFVRLQGAQSGAPVRHEVLLASTGGREMTLDAVCRSGQNRARTTCRHPVASLSSTLDSSTWSCSQGGRKAHRGRDGGHAAPAERGVDQWECVPEARHSGVAAKVRLRADAIAAFQDVTLGSNSSWRRSATSMRSWRSRRRTAWPRAASSSCRSGCAARNSRRGCQRHRVVPPPRLPVSRRACTSWSGAQARRLG